MSTDESVTKDIIQTLEDGKDGFTKGAEKLDELKEPQLVAQFREFAQQRSTFADELQEMAKAYGDQVDKSGSVAAALHRGWMSLKDAVTKSDSKAILEVAKQGEDHAVSEYEKALGEDISGDLRLVLQRQFDQVKVARNTVAALVPSAS